MRFTYNQLRVPSVHACYMPRWTHPYLCYYSNNILHGIDIILHYRALAMVNDSLTHSPFLRLCPSSKS